MAKLAPAVAVGMLAGLVAGGPAHAAPELSAEIPPTGVYGGQPTNVCGWPTTVYLAGCTGTLVHPQVVIYAAHCPDASQVLFGETESAPARAVATQFCQEFPGGGATFGNDFAFCVLQEPQLDIPIVPPLFGCETDELQPGRDVTIVGFGLTESGQLGDKYEVVTQIVEIDTVMNEIRIGGGGKDSCGGDSGGPVYIKLNNEGGSDGSWRVFGITSYGSNPCGPGGWYSMMHLGMEWFEQQSGFDLTPCFDVDGTWNPGLECGEFPLDPQTGGGSWAGACEWGPMGGPSAVCGPPFSDEPDEVGPTVSISAPEDRSEFTSDPETGRAAVTVVVEADDGDGWGMQQVQLVLDGAAVPEGIDTSDPYEFRVSLDPGIYEVSAIGVDRAMNATMAEAIVIGVDMTPPPPDPDDTGTEGTSGTDGGGEDQSDRGCGCRPPADVGSPALLLLVLASRRRRGR